MPNIPPEMRILIKDCEKTYTLAKAKAIYIRHQLLYNSLAKEQAAFEKL